MESLSASPERLGLSVLALLFLSDLRSRTSMNSACITGVLASLLLELYIFGTLRRGLPVL